MKKTKIAGIFAVVALVVAIGAFLLQPTPKVLDQETAKVEETASTPEQVFHVTGTTDIVLGSN